MVVSLGAEVQQLEQRDREGGGTKAMSDQDAPEVFIETELELLEIGPGCDFRQIHCAQRLGNALSLRMRKAPLFEF